MQSFIRLFFALFIVFSTQSVLAVSFTNMYVFGDSLSDNGNLFAATAATGPIPDPVYYDQGRFQDGENYAEHLWSSLGLSGSLSPRVPSTTIPPQGTNYAVGGARTRYHEFDLNPATGLPPTNPAPYYSLSLLGQVDLYQSDGITPDSNALFTVWNGGNDLSDILNVNQQIGSAAAYGLMNQSVNDFGLAIQRLAATGATNFFLPNLPDIGLTPEVQALGPDVATSVRNLVMAYNGAVDTLLGMPDFSALNILRFDVFSLFDDLMADPAAYGFSDAGTSCLTGYFVTHLPNPPPDPNDISLCSNPEDYVFYDKFHPTAATHLLLASEMSAYLLPVPTPLALLGLGLAAIGYTRRKKQA